MAYRCPRQPRNLAVWKEESWVVMEISSSSEDKILIEAEQKLCGVKEFIR